MARDDCKLDRNPNFQLKRRIYECGASRFEAFAQEFRATLKARLARNHRHRLRHLELKHSSKMQPRSLPNWPQITGFS